MPTLLAMYILNQGTQASLFIIAALICSTIGDVALMIKTKKESVFFIFGMGAFMAGHICYFFWFLQKSLPIQITLPWIIAVILCIFFTSWFWKTMSKTKNPLAPGLSAYCVFLDLLIIGSLLTWGTGPLLGTLLCLTGALLFSLSDFFIAMGMVDRKIGDAGLIMATYTLGQLLLAIGVMVLS